MNIKVNGKPTELDQPISIQELMESRGIKPGEVVIQYNGEIIDKTLWATTVLKENDDLEILRFVGGG